MRCRSISFAVLLFCCVLVAACSGPRSVSLDTVTHRLERGYYREVVIGSQQVLLHPTDGGSAQVLLPQDSGLSAQALQATLQESVLTARGRGHRVSVSRQPSPYRQNGKSGR